MTRREFFRFPLGVSVAGSQIGIGTSPTPPRCPFDGGALDELGALVAGLSSNGGVDAQVIVSRTQLVTRCQTCGLVSVIPAGAQ